MLDIRWSEIKRKLDEYTWLKLPALIVLAVSLLVSVVAWITCDKLIAVASQGNGFHLVLLLMVVVPLVLCGAYGLLIAGRQRLYGKQLRQQALLLTQSQQLARFREQMLKEMHLLPTLNNILSGHLGEATSSTESAALVIMTHLQDVHQQSSQFLQALQQQQEKARQIATDQEKRRQINQQMLLSIMQYQTQREEQMRLDAQQIEEVFVRVRELTGMTDIISRLAAQTNMLAINAAIEAAHAGSHARGFKAVADEVRKLSRQTSEAAQRIYEGIEMVSSTVRDNLADIVSKVRTDEESRQLTDISAKFGELTGDAQAMASYLSEITLSGIGAGEGIFAGVMGMLENMQFQDISRQQIQQVQAALEQLNYYFQHVSDGHGTLDAESLTVENIIEQVQQSYVMHKQQKVHNNILGDDLLEDDAPKIELF
jgi:methyl-accepting chemotaxis protein